MELKRFYLFLILVFPALFSSYAEAGHLPGESNDFVVVLDAGHGGHDPGNLGNGYLEKNIALNIVLKVGEALEAEPGIKVIYTRKDDSFVDLYVRGEIANKANADLFVSVHCDSHSSDANGAGTFVLGLHANKQNFEIAKKENSAIYLEDNYETRYAQYDINSPETVIGLTIMQEEFLDQSIMLAKMMQDNFSNKLKRNDRKVKQAGFIVLHQTFMPSVLVETGFLTNKTEGTYLNSGKGQSEMGRAIADAVLTYKNSVRGIAQPPAARTSTIAEKAPDPKPAVVEKAEEVVAKTEPVASEKSTTGAVEQDRESAEIEKELKSTQAVKEEQTPIIAETKPEENKSQPAKEVSAEPIEKKEVVKRDVEVKTAEPPKEEVAVEKAVEAPKSAASDITFKVQLLASSKDLPLRSEDFKGLNQLSKEPYKNLFRYLYGNVSVYKQAELLQRNAALKGYKTAFIVAYKDGERIPVPEAVKYLMNQ